MAFWHNVALFQGIAPVQADLCLLCLGKFFGLGCHLLGQASFSKDSKEGSAEPEPGVSFPKPLLRLLFEFWPCLCFGLCLGLKGLVSLGWLRLWKLGFHLCLFQGCLGNLCIHSGASLFLEEDSGLLVGAFFVSICRVPAQALCPFPRNLSPSCCCCWCPFPRVFQALGSLFPCLCPFPRVLHWALPGLVVIPVPAVWGSSPGCIVWVLQVLQVLVGCLFQGILHHLLILELALAHI